MPDRLPVAGRAVILAVALSGSAAVAQTPNPALTAGDNTWQLVSTGEVLADPNITSYSGGWYDPVQHAFCLFGGGHWDYSGNEVWCFDIDTLTWSELYAPDEITDQGDPQGAYNNYQPNFPGALFNPAGEPIEDANPVSRHTYDQLEFVDGLGPIAFGGYTWGDSGMPWCFLCGDTWAFDQTTTRWTYMSGHQTPDWVGDGSVGGSAYSTTGGKLYTLAAGVTWTFDPARNTWQGINTSGNPPYSIEHTMEYDPARNVIYVLGGNYPANGELWRFDIASSTWTNLNPSGNGPDTSVEFVGAANGPGLAFDRRNDVLLVYGGGTIWVYDPDTNSWNQPATPAVRPIEFDYVFGRFRYDPVNDGAWLHVVENGEHRTWFYRYRDPNGQNAAPVPAPGVSMSVSPPGSDGTQVVTLQWSSTNATSCQASGDWSGPRPSDGSEGIGAAVDPVTFTLACQGPGGNGARTITISADGAGGGGIGGGGVGSSGSSGGGGGSALHALAVWLLLLSAITVAARRRLSGERAR